MSLAFSEWFQANMYRLWAREKESVKVRDRYSLKESELDTQTLQVSICRLTHL